MRRIAPCIVGLTLAVNLERGLTRLTLAVNLERGHSPGWCAWERSLRSAMKGQAPPLHFGYLISWLFLVDYTCYHIHSFWAFGNRYDAAGGLDDGVDAFEAAAGYEQDDTFVFC